MYVDAEWVANESYGSRLESDVRPDCDQTQNSEAPRPRTETEVESGVSRGGRTIPTVAFCVLAMMVILNLALSVAAITLYFRGYPKETSSAEGKFAGTHTSVATMYVTIYPVLVFQEVKMLEEQTQ